MDQNVRGAVSRGLRQRSVDVLAAWEDGTSEADDEGLLERATQLARLLVSEDQDFLTITAAWLAAGRPFSGVAYVHRLRVSIGQAIEDLEVIARASEPAEVANCVFHLPL